MKTKFFVGTSGWAYSWNKGGSLDWYVSDSGLNAVELNASFYRFPFPNQIAGWSRKGRGLSWSIKVNKSITHMYKFSDDAVQMLRRFIAAFKVMDKLIDNYLFQLPPSMKVDNLDRIISFIEESRPKLNAVLEPRDVSWFNEEVYSTLRGAGLALCSIDSPIGSFIVKTTDRVYLRLHGRKTWYRYNYSRGELSEIIDRVLESKPREAFIFFNNDENMLKNAVETLKIIGEL
ncbi:MAG: DUF72 domain-containing protein [Candidatus Parvarchaeota archaeon]|nr:DUF72 domain-containing protein [Candidatus Parvarchaeota archaeon]MCW1301602.1 DUF72 domain-containing protein [Candidatus Parvarchaeota archaeon]